MQIRDNVDECDYQFNYLANEVVDSTEGRVAIISLNRTEIIISMQQKYLHKLVQETFKLLFITLA